MARRIVSRLVFEDGDDLEGVRGLSRAAARAVLERGRTTRLAVADRRRSAVDPFVKYLFRADDGRAFEAVRIPLERPRWSVCVSSQAGCALGCAFCETGRLGLRAQPRALGDRRAGPDRAPRVAGAAGDGRRLPGPGRALPELRRSDPRGARSCATPAGPGIRGDRITISTVGLLPLIERYTDEGHPYRLILSLTSAFDEKRAQPGADRAALRRAGAGGGDAPARATARRAGEPGLGADGRRSTPAPRRRASWRASSRGVRVRLSVIDVNDPTGRFRRADDAERVRFLSALAAHGIGFVRRYSGGPDIHAACGMLAQPARGGAPRPRLLRSRSQARGRQRLQRPRAERGDLRLLRHRRVDEGRALQRAAQQPQLVRA